MSGLRRTRTRWFLCIAVGSVFCFPANCAIAQITPDSTLPENSRVSIQESVRIIEGGTRTGGNLFHSFEVFSVPTGSTAFFNNAQDIQNIISRVTGGSVSNIEGLIRVSGTANLFLINPNGIIFGQNARLDIKGSFIASTASGLNFADSTQFSATASQDPPLLTVSVPIGLQFTSNPQRILVRGNGRGLRRQENPVIDTNNALRIQPDQTLALVGGDVTFEGGTLKTAGGRIELGSIAGAGNVSLTAVEKGFSLGYEGITSFGDIQLLRATAVDASGEGGGEIQIRGKQVVLRDGSQIEATRLERGSGGKLTVTASDVVELSGTTADNLGDNRRFPSSLSVDNRKVGDIPGELTINTRQLIIRPGGRISASNAGQGRGGNITVNASDSVELIGIFNAMGGLRSSGLSVQTTSSGDAGRLVINTKNLTLRDGAELSASTFGAGNGGIVEVNASDSVELLSTNGQIRSRIVAEVGRDLREVNRQGESAPATGQGGNLTIRTRQLTVRDGAAITVSSRSEDANAQGAGSLEVTAQSIRLDNFGQIAAATSSGQGGNITLQVQDLLLLRRNSLISTTAGSAQAGGDGGNININTDFIAAVPSENSDITANAFKGRGGNVSIQASGIFGITRRDRGTPESDITASSDLGINGTVNIDTPDLDPSQGLVQLPANLVDATQQVATGCTRGSKQRNGSFIATARGGIPPSPTEPLMGDAVLANWVTLLNPEAQQDRSGGAIALSDQSVNISPPEIVEARGWIIDANSNVTLVATAPNVTPHNPNFNQTSCSAY